MEFKVERLQKESIKQSNVLNEKEGQLLQANKLKKNANVECMNYKFNSANHLFIVKIR